MTRLQYELARQLVTMLLLDRMPGRRRQLRRHERTWVALCLAELLTGIGPDAMTKRGGGPRQHRHQWQLVSIAADGRILEGCAVDRCTVTRIAGRQGGFWDEGPTAEVTRGDFATATNRLANARSYLHEEEGAAYFELGLLLHSLEPRTSEVGE